MQKKHLILCIFAINFALVSNFNLTIVSAQNSTFTVNIIQEEPIIKDGKYVMVAGIWHDISITGDISDYEIIKLTIFKEFDEPLEKNVTNYYQWEYQKTGSEQWNSNTDYGEEYIDLEGCFQTGNQLSFRVGVQDVLPDEIFAQQEWIIQINTDATLLHEEAILIEKPTRGFAKSHGDHIAFNIDPFTEMQTQASDYIILKNTGNVPLFVRVTYEGLDDYLDFSHNDNIISPDDKQQYQLLLDSPLWQPQKIVQQGIATAQVLSEYIVGGESSGIAVSLQTAFIIDVPQIDIFVGHSDYILENLFDKTGFSFQYKKSITMQEGDSETVRAYISGDGSGKISITVDDSLILESINLDDSLVNSPFTILSTNDKEQKISIQIKSISENKNGKIHYMIESEGKTQRFSTMVYVQAPIITDDSLMITGTSTITVFVLIAVIIAAGFMLYNHLSYGRKS